MQAGVLVRQCLRSTGLSAYYVPHLAHPQCATKSVDLAWLLFSLLMHTLGRLCRHHHQLRSLSGHLVSPFPSVVMRDRPEPSIRASCIALTSRACPCHGFGQSHHGADAPMPAGPGNGPPRLPKYISSSLSEPAIADNHREFHQCCIIFPDNPVPDRCHPPCAHNKTRRLPLPPCGCKVMPS
jgi:hypothetical protein